MIGRNRGAVSPDRVNPHSINGIDQIHTVPLSLGAPLAIPFDHDLIQRRRRGSIGLRSGRCLGCRAQQGLDDKLCKKISSKDVAVLREEQR